MISRLCARVTLWLLGGLWRLLVGGAGRRLESGPGLASTRPLAAPVPLTEEQERALLEERIRKTREFFHVGTTESGVYKRFDA